MMNGGLSQRSRILRHVDSGFSGALEGFNRACHSNAVRELQFPPAADAGDLQLAPAEEWQADADDQADAHPTLSPRFGFLLLLFVAAVIAHHAPWSAAL